MKRAESRAREYYNAKHGHRARVHVENGGGVRMRMMWRGDMLASPWSYRFESFEDAVRALTARFGAWERVEYVVGSIGW